MSIQKSKYHSLLGVLILMATAALSLKALAGEGVTDGGECNESFWQLAGSTDAKYKNGVICNNVTEAGTDIHAKIKLVRIPEGLPHAGDLKETIVGIQPGCNDDTCGVSKVISITQLGNIDTVINRDFTDAVAAIRGGSSGDGLVGRQVVSDCSQYDSPAANLRCRIRATEDMPPDRATAYMNVNIVPYIRQGLLAPVGSERYQIALAAQKELLLTRFASLVRNLERSRRDELAENDDLFGGANSGNLLNMLLGGRNGNSLDSNILLRVLLAQMFGQQGIGGSNLLGANLLPATSLAGAYARLPGPMIPLTGTGVNRLPVISPQTVVYNQQMSGLYPRVNSYVPQSAGVNSLYTPQTGGLFPSNSWIGPAGGGTQFSVAPGLFNGGSLYRRPNPAIVPFAA